jgi:hypothetical protein
MVRDIDVLNEEMEAAGARFFAGGLQSAPRAKSLRKQAVVACRASVEVREFLAMPTE